MVVALLLWADLPGCRRGGCGCGCGAVMHVSKQWRREPRGCLGTLLSVPGMGNGCAYMKRNDAVPVPARRGSGRPGTDRGMCTQTPFAGDRCAGGVACCLACSCWLAPRAWRSKSEGPLLEDQIARSAICRHIKGSFHPGHFVWRGAERGGRRRSTAVKERRVASCSVDPQRHSGVARGQARPV